MEVYTKCFFSRGRRYRWKQHPPPAGKRVCTASDGSGFRLKIKLLPPPPPTKLRLRIKRPVLPPTAKKIRLGMNTASSYLPKDNDAKPLGEDAHFLLQERQTIGVANDVGSWAKKGIDAGIYARELMDHAFSSAVSLEPSKAVDPKALLLDEHSKTKAQGSFTACIVTLRREDNKLCYANVGDSGFLVFRNKRLLFRSPTQQHRFNCPYQLKNAGRPRFTRVKLRWRAAMTWWPGRMGCWITYLLRRWSGFFRTVLKQDKKEKSCPNTSLGTLHVLPS
ncbi:hypothetical protein Tsubulata_004844 [Turnera subulata]|uniref:Protein phosphatase n=1 Tax=Turnera subulata TaxID=218843 RepID=A0A9Q0GI14_9ROSI|nr:hypothetical protein Tsubulata_004844 [Turnera subulata]